MTRVKEVSSVVIGNCKGKEARISPDQIFREGEYLNILYILVITRNIRLLVRKKAAIDPNPRVFLTFTSLNHRKDTILGRRLRSICP